MVRITVNYAREGESWVARTDDLPGLVGRGETPQEAISNLEDAIRAELDDMDGEFCLDMMIMEDMFGR